MPDLSHIAVSSCLSFTDVLHLLPTKEAVSELNTRRLAALGKPVIRCLAKHNCAEAKKASDEDADGLQTEVLLAEGARVMITRNVWTSKGKNQVQKIIERDIDFN